MREMTLLLSYSVKKQQLHMFHGSCCIFVYHLVSSFNKALFLKDFVCTNLHTSTCYWNYMMNKCEYDYFQNIHNFLK